MVSGAGGSAIAGERSAAEAGKPRSDRRPIPTIDETIRTGVCPSWANRIIGASQWFTVDAHIAVRSCRTSKIGRSGLAECKLLSQSGVCATLQLLAFSMPAAAKRAFSNGRGNPDWPELRTGTTSAVDAQDHAGGQVSDSVMLGRSTTAAAYLVGALGMVADATTRSHTVEKLMTKLWVELSPRGAWRGFARRMGEFSDAREPGLIVPPRSPRALSDDGTFGLAVAKTP